MPRPETLMICMIMTLLSHVPSLTATAQSQLSPTTSAPSETPAPASSTRPSTTLLTSANVEGDPDYCINIMAGFPTDDPEARYQFFKLTQEMARDATPEFRIALSQYGDGPIAAETPLLDVIEDIANPVLRQAAPEITTANMAYVINFASRCEPFITGQIDSLIAYDNALTDAEFNAVITEDALFLRQILSDSLFRLGANEDPVHRFVVMRYSDSLVTTRDIAEFSTFEAELDNLEALYMEDLDGRLKRSNDLINEEMDREILGDSVTLSDSLNAAEKQKAKQRQIYTLIRILGGGR